MSRRLQLNIAQALLRARLKQTLVAAVGVTFSITMFIALLSFMTGLNKLLDNLIINRTPHVRLFNEIQQNPNQPIMQTTEYKGAYNFISSIKTANSREELYNSGAILRALQNDSRVQGVSPKISTPAFFNEGNASIAATVNGIDVQAENRLFHFYDYITRGAGENLSMIPNSIVLGKALADKLAVDVDDIVYITMPGGSTFPLKVVAFYQSGINDFDKVLAFTSIITAQKLLGKPANYLTDIQVRLKNIDLSPAVAKEYRSLFGTQAEDIQTANAQFETGSSIRGLISYTVGITLLIVAGFGIYNILNMMIYEKMDTIAILKATGFSGRDVRQIFLLIALSIGFFGGLIGLLLGYVFSAIIDAIPFNTAALPTVKTFPVNYNPLYYFIGIFFSLITTYLAGLFPAAKAGRIDPVVIIRGK